MATRGLIGYLDTDGDLKLTTTYCHYDSYPENLGKGLETFYDDDAKAKEIASVGYISFLDGENGDWENTSSNTRPAEVIQLPDNFNDAMEKIAEEIDNIGGNYGYIWDNENMEWITVRNQGINKMTKDLEMALAHLKGKFEIFPEQPEQTMEEGNLYHNELASLEKEGRFWIVSWRGENGPKEKVFTDEDEAREFMYNLNKPTPEIPGFEGTRAELDDLFEAEYLKRQWQHRAGIIKEGVWSVLPARIPEFIKAIEAIKDKYHGVVGSDDVYNGLDAAIDAAKDLMSMSEGTKTKSDDLFEAEYTKRQWQYRAGIIK